MSVCIRLQLPKPLATFVSDLGFFCLSPPPTSPSPHQEISSKTIPLSLEEYGATLSGIVELFIHTVRQHGRMQHSTLRQFPKLLQANPRSATLSLQCRTILTNGRIGTQNLVYAAFNMPTRETLRMDVPAARLKKTMDAFPPLSALVDCEMRQAKMIRECLDLLSRLSY